MSEIPNRSQDTSARQLPDYLVVGRVARPHGVRGALLVEPFSEVITSLEPGSRIYIGDEEFEHRLKEIRPHQKRYLAFLEGCEDRTEAEKYRDREIKVSLDMVTALPEHTYYRWQILDLRVETVEGKPLGTVVHILETGANDVYVVEDEGGEELLIPAIHSVIRTIDLDRGKIIVQLLEGME